MSGTKYQMTVLGVSLRMHVCVHVSYNRCEQQNFFAPRNLAHSRLSALLAKKICQLQNPRPRFEPAPTVPAHASSPLASDVPSPALFLLLHPARVPATSCPK